MQTIVGDITQVTGGVIVHGCNAQGVMGSGVALAIKNKWPEVYKEYKDFHDVYGLKLGEIVPVWVNPNLVVINAITQEFYGRDGKRYLDYKALLHCFCEIDHHYRGLDLNFPMIGAGLAGGDWEQIAGIISLVTNAYTKKNLWILGG